MPAVNCLQRWGAYYACSPLSHDFATTRVSRRQETSINEKRLILLRSFPSEARVCWRGPEEEVPSQADEGLADPLSTGVSICAAVGNKRGYSYIRTCSEVVHESKRSSLDLRCSRLNQGLQATLAGSHVPKLLAALSSRSGTANLQYRA